jgi:hypothetical protein
MRNWTSSVWTLKRVSFWSNKISRNWFQTEIENCVQRHCTYLLLYEWTWKLKSVIVHYTIADRLLWHVEHVHVEWAVGFLMLVPLFLWTYHMCSFIYSEIAREGWKFIQCSCFLGKLAFFFLSPIWRLPTFWARKFIIFGHRSLMSELLNTEY